MYEIEKLIDNLTCPICYDYLVDPVETNCCRNTFCYRCIDKLNKLNGICAICRKRISYTPSIFAKRLMNSMLAKCEYCKEEIKNHQLSCTKFETKGSFCQQRPKLNKSTTRISLASIIFRLISLIMIGALIFFFLSTKNSEKHEIIEKSLMIIGSIQNFFSGFILLLRQYAPLCFNTIMFSANQAFESILNVINSVSVFKKNKFKFETKNILC